MMPLSLTSMAAPDRAAGGNSPSQARVDADPRRLQRAMADLVATGSLEMGAHRPQDAREIAALLPTGTPVYVNHLPRHSLNDTLNGLIAVRDAGLDPVPHIAAKRVGSRQEIRVFLERAVRQAGVKKVLIPEENVKDLADIPDNVKNRLEIVPVKWIDRVLEVALERAPSPLPDEAPVAAGTAVAAAPDAPAGDVVAH